MKRFVVVAFTIAASEVVGCSFFTSLDGLQGGDSSGSDSGGTSAPDVGGDGNFGDANVVNNDARAPNDAGADAAEVDGSAYRATVLADSPLAYWRLGEKSGTILHDETTTNDGSYSSTAQYGKTGALANDTDTAVFCNGTDPIATVPATMMSFGGSAPMSIEFWLRPTTTFDSNPYFIFNRETGAPGSRQGYDAYISEGMVSFERITAGNNFEIVAANSVPENVYSHFLFTFDGTTANLYVNGAAVDGRVFTSKLASVSASLILGYGGGSGFQGELDEFAVYDHALSATRALEHFRVGSGM